MAIRKFLLFLLLCPAAAAQYAPTNATVTATVVDSDGTAWAGGTWTLIFNPTGYANIFKVGGQFLDPAVVYQTGTLSNTGYVSISLYENTTITPSPSTTNWALKLCPNATGGCGTYNFYLTSSSTDLSGGITSAITAPRFQAVAGTYGYTDLEASVNLTNGAEYVNVNSPCLKFYAGSWICLGAAVPSGMIGMIASGTCPAGWTEDDSIAGNYIIATTHAAGDVGTTGGSLAYTPAGSVSAPAFTGGAATLTGTVTQPTFAGSSATLTGSVAAPTFTGSSSNISFGTITFSGSGGTTGATSAGTPAGSVANGTIAWPAGVPTIAAGTFTQPSFTGNAGTTGATSGGTPAGSNSGGSFTEGALTWPAGVPTIAAGTFTQPTIAWPTPVPTFSGASDTTSSVSGGTPAGTNSGGAFSIVTTHEASGTSNYVATTMNAVALTSSTTSVTLTTQPTFTGSALAGHTHTVTPTGTVAWPTGGSSVPTASSGAFTEGAISWPAGVPTIAAGTFTQPTFSGSALGTHTHSFTPSGTISGGAYTDGAVSWPSGVPSETSGAFSGSALGTHTHSFTPSGSVTIATSTTTAAGSNSAPALTMNSYTPSGTVSQPTLSMNSYTPTGTIGTPAFSGTPATITPVYYKMIPCMKN